MKILIRILLTGLVFTGLAFVAPGTASAHGWTEPNSWAGSHTLGRNHLDRGSVVAMWQKMIHAQFGGGCEGLGGCTYKTDGIFGTNTHDRTIVWQAFYRASLVPGMSVDGVVGPQTWNAARFFNLHRVGGDRNFDYHCYGTCGVYETGFPMSFAKGYATWLASGWACDLEVIDHPTVRNAWMRSCY